MTVAPEPRTYDVVVIGGGPAGEVAAQRAVRGGLTAALVERELLGGECSYWACMPSKALLRDGEVLAQARSLPGAGAAVTGDLDAAKVLARRDEFASHWDDSGQAQWAAGADIDVVRGHGRLAGERRVVVETSDGSVELTARHAVVLATGSTAAIPPIPGLAEARPWTNREGTDAKEVPPRLAVLGGGVVGCELSTAWASLGSEVVLIEKGDRLLPMLEPFAGDLVRESLGRQGVEVRLGAGAVRVERDGDGPTTVHLDSGASIEADALLVAVGRRPATGDLGLDTVGLEPRAYVTVDDTLAATALDGEPWLYAVGDVNGRRLLTHMGKYQGRCAGDVIAARASGQPVATPPWSAYTASADDAATPSVVFTDPAVGSVGLTEQVARERGLPVRTVEYDLGAVAGASLLGDGYAGRAKLVVDEERRVVVGATFVGRETAELLHSATVAVVGEVPLDRLWHAVPSYPTVSEIWLRLLETYGL